MRLKDLVHRSALRNRSAGETEVGFSPQVFEVTNLVIPAGTDWGDGTDGLAHVLGTLSALGVGQGIAYSIYLELAAVPNPDAPSLQVVESRDDTFAQALAAQVFGRFNGVDNGVEVPGSQQDVLAPLPPTVDWRVQIVTFGPTTADITVVRARAAFLVI